MRTRWQKEIAPRPVGTEELIGILRPTRTMPRSDDRVLVWTDDHRNRDRVLRWDGPCIGCEIQTWSFDDGENDPRGILGDSAMYGVPVPPRPDLDEADQVELEARACPLCANVEGSYRAIHAEASRNFTKTLPYQWGRSTLAE